MQFYHYLIHYRYYHVQSLDYLLHLSILAIQIPDQYNISIGGISTHLCNSTEIQEPYDFSNEAFRVCNISSLPTLNTPSELYKVDLLLYYQDELATCLVYADHLYDFFSFAL